MIAAVAHAPAADHDEPTPETARPTTMPPSQTELAERAVAVAATFEGAVRRVFSAYSVDLTMPEVWTSGGEHALQHVRLVTSEGTTLLLGSVNVAARTAKLRTLGHTLALSKRRFGRELVLPPKEYLRFLDVATRVLEALGMRVVVVAYAEPEVRPARVAGEDGTVSASGLMALRRTTLPYLDGTTAMKATTSGMVMR